MGEFTSRFRLARAGAANLNDNNKSVGESIFPVQGGNQWGEKHSNGANARARWKWRRLLCEFSGLGQAGERVKRKTAKTFGRGHRRLISAG